jgi:hypothetical protein
MKEPRRYAVTFRRRPLSASTPNGLVERRVVVIAQGRKVAEARAWEQLARVLTVAPRAAYYVLRVTTTREPIT